MYLLVYGGNGWIGTQFLSFLEERGVEYCLGTARVDDVQIVANELDRVRPTHVLSLIGRTSGVYGGKTITTIDFLEQPGNLVLNIRDNLFAPLVLAILCKERLIHFTYLGTGCIFNYDQGYDTETGFTEDNIPNFTGSSYSIVKGYTDRLMHLFDDTTLNLRIRMPISNEDHPRNFISKIIRYQKICSVPNSMTVLRDFFPVFADLMVKNATGTYNCSNPGVINHNEILEMYRYIVDPNFKWQNFTIEEQRKILDAERSNNYLDTTKIEAYNVPPIREAIKQVLMDWKLNNCQI